MSSIPISSGGAGGSSYISGHEGCKSTDENGNSVDDCVHSSGWKFKDTVMIDGDGYEWADSKLGYVQMQSPQGNYVNGNNSDGYARITLLEDPSQNNLLKEIQLNKGTISPEFNYDTTDYKIELGSEDTSLTVYGVVDDIKSTVEGNGTYDIKSGENTIKLNVTAESGDIKTYTLTVKRPSSSNSKPANITIDGLIESIINVDPKYGKLNPEKFDPDVHEYSMIVPSRIKKLTFNVEKGHKYQTVTGDGTIDLQPDENIIKINITSEDKSSTDTYTYKIIRDMSGNCMLKSLTIDNVDTDLNFDQDVLEYFIEVENEVTNLDITAIPEMDTVTQKIIGNTNLQVGLNDIYIINNAPNGEQLVYIIHAYRKQSGNVFLSSLKVKNGDNELKLDPVYNKLLDTYEVNVGNEIDKVNIEAIPEALTSSVSGAGEKNLKTGTNTFEIIVTSEDSSIGKYNININRDQSSNNYLKTLITTAGDFDKEFNKENQEYEITVDSNISKLPLVVEPEDNKATYKILQNNNFITGSNYVIIRVTAENGEQRDYKIKVNKNPSNNNYLANINLSNGSLNPVFNKETYDYTIEVENENDTINIEGIKEDNSSKLSGNGTYALEKGENSVILTVTAENGDIRSYNLNIIRKDNSNKNLLRIDNDKNEIVNKIDENTYEINVRNEIENITLNGIPEVETTTVSGNGKYDLKIGENKVILTAKAEDNSTKDYTIIINRLKSDNAYLKSVFAKEGELYENFEKTKTEYHLKVQNDVNELTLDVVPEDNEATYEILNNSNFKFGNNYVTIRVTASDGLTKKDYKLVVYKQPELERKCDLINLSVDKGNLTPDFDANNLVYNVDLPYEEDKITVNATSLDNTAIVTGTGEHNLQVGLNVITVKVTSTSGDEKVYQIKVNRAKSTNANLSSLIIQNHTITPEFNKDVVEYNVETKLSNLELKPTTEDENATYEIIGNSDFKKGTNDVKIKVTAPDGVTTKIYTIKATKTGSDNNNLAFLGVNGYSLNPEFNKSTLVYNVSVPNDVKTAYIDAVPDDKNSTVVGTGVVKLNDGKNVYEVEDCSESGKVKKYIVNINRGLSDNNYLADLKTTEGIIVPEFDKKVNNYDINVEYEVENINLIGYPEDSNSTVSGNGSYNLNIGDNKIEIIVISASGKENKYIINVNRKPPISAKLADLEVKNYKIKPQYNMNTNLYSVDVDNEITSLDMIIKTLDPNATYVVNGNENFKVGNNEVIITVTSSDGKLTEDYKILVNRLLSSNNYLSYILPSQGTLTPGFDKLTNNYDIIVDNDITKINIDADPEDSKSTLTGNGEYDLNVGNNKIELKVTSSIGVSRIYTINVERKKNGNNYLKNLSAKANGETVQISPNFNKETLEYTIDVPVGTTKMQFIGEPENTLATASGLGYISLVGGENVHNINVTAENGDIRTYKITVNRAKYDINNLTDIVPSVGKLEPSFSYGTTEYNLTLGNADSLLSFDVTTENRFATVSGEEGQEVPNGESVRKIVVTAENGDTKTYTINVNRIRTDDARLKNLQIKSYSLDQEFNSDVYEYTLTVPNDKFEFTENEVIATPMYETTQVFPKDIIELSVLKLNTYQIKTLAADGYTTQTYTIYITREKSSNSKLSKLAVSGCKIEPEFSSDILEYTVYVPKKTKQIKSDDIIAIPQDQYATVVKPDIVELDNGKGICNIDVTSHNGATNTNYKINIEEEKSNNNYLQSLKSNVGTFEPEFDTNITEYKLHVTPKQTSIDIEAIPQDLYAHIEKGNGKIDISGDSNKILVIVRAENDDARIYIIDVVKDAKIIQKICGKINTENSVNNKSLVKLYKSVNTSNEEIGEYDTRQVISQVETNDDGTFEIETDIDKYDIVVSKDGYLNYKVINIDIEEGETIEIEPYELIAGDVVETGEIEIDDLVALNECFGVKIDESNKDKYGKFDFNGDGIINELDRNILKKNYGKLEEISQIEKTE